MKSATDETTEKLLADCSTYLERVLDILGYTGQILGNYFDSDLIVFQLRLNEKDLDAAYLALENHLEEMKINKISTRMWDGKLEVRFTREALETFDFA